LIGFSLDWEIIQSIMLFNKTIHQYN
jgi:hypothetical protein